MASDDVIELCSSEDEAEPAPKKRKYTSNAMVNIPTPRTKVKIPTPNAMVNIPNKIKDELIKPIMSNATNHNINQKSKIIRPGFKNFNTAKGNQANIKIRNPSQIQLRNPIAMGVLPKANQLSVGFSVIKSFPKEKSLPVVTKHKLTFDQAAMDKMSKKRLKSVPVAQKTNLPKQLASLPGITIKPLSNAGISGTKQKQKVSILSKSNFVSKPTTNKNKNNVGEVLTIELEDEDVTESSTGSPQWYLKPGEERLAEDELKSEKQKDEPVPSMEEINNKEPEKPNYVEITIEDSPVKPLQLKHSEVGKELPIIVEDSPIKPLTKISSEEGSDTEQSVRKVKHSKKQLNYPKDKNVLEEVVEIEIDLIQTDVDASENLKDHTNQQSDLNSSVEQIQESTKCEPEILETGERVNAVSEVETQVTVLKIDIKEKDNAVSIIDIKEKDNAVSIIEIKDKVDDSKEQSPVIETKDKEGEFHQVYQNFIDLCFELENSDDMKKIVEKKIKSYYKQCPKDYVESEEFIEMVSSKTLSMRASPDKMYLYIKDIVDELNVQRKMKRTEFNEIEGIETGNSKDKYSQNNECDNKKQRQIRKLERAIKKLNRIIKKLEEQDVDFDDDDGSVYIETERYKERLVRVYAKFCQLTKTKMPSEPRVHIEARPGRPQGPAKRLEMWINKKVPIGKPLPFPDFHDVLKCVREANSTDKLCWNEVEIMEEARDLFTRCGKKLQRRRQENEWRIASSRVSHNTDPAEINMDLKKRLDENKSIAAKKETEVFNKYADRQNQLKLEAEEIGDKEAEESPVESDEEEDVVVETNTAELKQKRKEKIKMLLKDKPINNDEKENNPVSTDKTICVNEDKTNKMEANDVATESFKMDIEQPLGEKQNVSNDEKVIDNAKGMTRSDSVGDVIASNDQLNLLSELYTEYKRVSTAGESSDSGSSITISDTLESESEAENKPKVFSDVISIENSSYSENESMDGDDEVTCLTSAIVEDVEDSTTLLENNIEDLDDVLENILLESSDEDNASQVVESDVICINLKDDNISITEVSLDGDVADRRSLDKKDGSIPDSGDVIQDGDNLRSEPKSNASNEVADNENVIEAVDNHDSTEEPLCYAGSDDVLETIANEGTIPEEGGVFLQDDVIETIENGGSIPESVNENESAVNDDLETMEKDGSIPESVNVLDIVIENDNSIETIENDGSMPKSVNSIDEITEKEAIENDGSLPESVNVLDRISGKDNFIETIDHDDGSTLESVNIIDEVTENDGIIETSNIECVEKEVINYDSISDNNNSLEIQDSPIESDNTSFVDEPMECDENPETIVERLQLYNNKSNNSLKIVDFKNVIDADSISNSPKIVDFKNVIDADSISNSPKIVDFKNVIDADSISNSPKIVDFKNVIDTDSVETIDSEQTEEVELTTQPNKHLNNFESNNENASFHKSDQDTQNIVTVEDSI